MRSGLRDLLAVLGLGADRSVPGPIRRFGWVAAGLILLYVALAVRLVQIQVIDRDQLAARARSQHRRCVTVPHRRGRIFGRHGEPLVITVRGWDLAVRVDDPRDGSVPPLEARARIVARALARPVDRIRARMVRVRNRGRRRWLEVARGLDDPGIVALARRHASWMSLNHATVRRQPRFPLASALLGRYGGRLANGRRSLTGLERALDEVLTGRDAQHEVLCDGHGTRLLLDGDTGVVEPGHAGADVYLTLDCEVQELAERVLDELMAHDHPAPGAGAVVLEAGSGEVLALASRPTSRDPRTWPYRGHGELGSFPWMVPLTCAVPPGSTFKPFTVGQALSGPEPVSLSDLVDCGQPPGTFGPVRIGRRAVRNFKARRHGLVTVEEALFCSYNTGMARLAEAMGLEPMVGLLERMGFRRRGGLFRLEVSPFWRKLRRRPGSTAPPSRWTPGYTRISWSFGQEMRLTLLDLATAYTALATDGQIRPPVLVRKVVYAPGQRPRGAALDRRPPRRVLFSPRVAARVREVLTRTIAARGGTLNRLFRTRPELFGGHIMAAKTGTATEEDASVRAALGRTAWRTHSENILSLVVMAPVGPGSARRYVVALVAPHPRATNRRTVSAGRVLGPYGVQIMRFLLDRDRYRPPPGCGRSGIEPQAGGGRWRPAGREGSRTGTGIGSRNIW